MDRDTTKPDSTALTSGADIIEGLPPAPGSAEEAALLGQQRPLESRDIHEQQTTLTGMVDRGKHVFGRAIEQVAGLPTFIREKLSGHRGKIITAIGTLAAGATAALQYRRHHHAPEPRLLKVPTLNIRFHRH